MSDEKSGTGDATRPDVGRAAIALGVALVVAVFAGLGIQGDLLARVVRNEWWLVCLAFGLVILGLTLPFFVRRADGRHVIVVEVTGLVLVLVGTATAGVAAVLSQGTREIPAIEVATTWADDGTASVAFAASGTSLRSDEDALLWVAAIHESALERSPQLCNSVARPWQDPNLGGDGRILHWGASGPDTSGAVSLATTVRVDPVEHRYVCGYVGLRDRSADSTNDNRASWLLLDLGKGAVSTPDSPKT